MKKLLFVLTAFVSTTLAVSQNFYYQSNLPVSVTVKDAVELNGKFYLVGQTDSSSVQRPFFGALNNSGVFELDTIRYSEGQFVNIHKVNGELNVSGFFSPISRLNQVLNLKFNANFAIQQGSFVADIILQKSRLLNDSTIAYLGNLPPPFANSTATAWVYLLNLNSGNSFGWPIAQTTAPTRYQLYDIFLADNGAYHVFSNSPDSVNTGEVTVTYLNDSLQPFRTRVLSSSYRAFGTDSTITGPVSVTFDAGKVYVNAIADHPSYINQSHSKDLAFVEYDTNYNELSVSYTGKTDTNYTTRRNTLAQNNNYFYTGGTGDGEVRINQYNKLGVLTDSVYHATGSTLELTKILEFNDSLLIIGKTGNQFFAVKVDNLRSGLLTTLFESSVLEKKVISVFPNPAVSKIQLALTSGLSSNVQIFNQTGSLVAEVSYNGEAIDVSHLKNGFYFMLISVKNESFSANFIKQD